LRSIPCTRLGAVDRNAEARGTNTTKEEFEKYLAEYDNYNYFFIHVKGTDMAGEDGNFDQKVAVIEEVDRALPGVTAKETHGLAVTGDHSTPVR
jgi:2,3-bisphosphoglycerate-independent phosphoglycerate mutase